MPEQTTRYLVALVLFVHGVGHTLGFVSPTRSWLMAGSADGLARWIAYALWAVATLGFVIAALGLVGVLVPGAWWRPAAITGSVVSLLGLALFWGSWPTAPAVAAAVVDIAVLVALLVLHWAPSDVAGG